MKNIKKKKWSKPECIKVELLPEEAVLFACKVGNGPNKCKSRGTQTFTYGS